MLLQILLGFGSVPIQPESLNTAGFAAADGTIAQNGPTPTDEPQAGIRIVNGSAQVQTATGDTGTALVYSNVGVWLDNPVDTTAYEIRVTQDSADAGGTFIGTLGTWETLNSTRVWTWEKDSTASGRVDWAGTFEIREIATPANIITYADLDISAEVFA